MTESLDSTVPYHELLYSMIRLRAVEETIAERYAEQEMRCPVHLSSGQEGVSAAVGACLGPKDMAVSGHRAHIHYLAKGGSLKRMLAEIYGRQTGCSSGKGGSMHLIDETVGFKGSTAIVGGTIPLGVGLGLSIALKKTKEISVIFLGDGAVEEGVFYEAANFAALKKLPVLFVCENNFYSVYSPIAYRQPSGRKIHEMVKGIGLDSHFGDGNDVVATYKMCSSAVERIRNGEGPVFLEFETYRWREHCGPNYDNDIGYRTEREYLNWLDRDPLVKFIAWLKNNDLIADAQISQMKEQINAEVTEAFDYARNSLPPKAEDAFTHLYSKGGKV